MIRIPASEIIGCEALEAIAVFLWEKVVEREIKSKSIQTQ
jgi:hypothetical protein